MQETHLRYFAQTPRFAARVLFAILAVVIAMAPTCHAMSVVPPTFEQLVSSADQILKVKVTGQRCAWDTTPTGHRVIHTYVSCRVLGVLKGAKQEVVELRFLGGSIGADSMTVEGLPKMQTGSVYYVFVNGNGTAFCPIAYGSYGGYRVLGDAATGTEHIARIDGGPLGAGTVKAFALAESTESVANMPNMTTGEFENLVRAAVLRKGGVHEK